jgi:6-phosphogluconolactonase
VSEGRAYLIGGYGPERGGTAAGLSEVGTAARLVARAPSPSWLVEHPALPIVYATLERDDLVSAFRRRGNRWDVFGPAVEVGVQPCHAAVSPDGQLLIVSSYGDGTLSAVRVNADGSLGEVTAVEPSATRIGAQSRAHGALFLADGTVATTDLGHDTVRTWRVSSGTLTQVSTVELPVGCGPRHLVELASGALLVLSELSNDLFLLRSIEGALEVVASVRLGVAGDRSAEVTYDEIHTVAHVAVRGADVLVTVSVDIERASLTVVGTTLCGGRWPRHHVELPDAIVVANERSNELTFVEKHEGTGILGNVIRRVPAPSPTCILELRA